MKKTTILGFMLAAVLAGVTGYYLGTTQVASSPQQERDFVFFDFPESGRGVYLDLKTVEALPFKSNFSSVGEGFTYASYGAFMVLVQKETHPVVLVWQDFDLIHRGHPYNDTVAEENVGAWLLGENGKYFFGAKWSKTMSSEDFVYWKGNRTIEWT